MGLQETATPKDGQLEAMKRIILPGDFMETWYLYQVECRTPFHVYIGITQSPFLRFKQHRLGRGALFTQKHGVKKAVVLKRFESYESAREAEDARTRQLDARGLITRGGSWTSSIYSCSIRDLSRSRPFWKSRKRRLHY